MPNKFSQFWQELKRRNVVQVITVYAGAAFVILSLVDMIREPFELPNWSFKLVVVILFVGLIIAVTLSWIYDIHPERGMVKTEPADKTKPEEPLRTAKGWKIASYISFVVILGLIVLNVIPRKGRKEIREKSIAVLPFDNDGPASENAAYINGYCTAVHSNLCKINVLRVLNLQSTEQYRNQPESIPEIAKNLGVSYVLTARGQIINNEVRLSVYLTDANDEIIWSHPYDRQIEVVEDHIDIQSEIAQLVADELQATITPKEMEIIESIPTTNVMAYEFYQKGLEEYWRYNSLYDNTEVLRGAETLLKYAIEYDSTFAMAYAGLAKVYYNLQSSGESYYSEDYLDTVLILANKALSFDPMLSDAYSIKGNYYAEIGMGKKAILSFERAVELNSNDWSAYYSMGRLYSRDDLVKAIDNYNQAISRYHGPLLSAMFIQLGFRYYAAGMLEKGDSCYLEASELLRDSTITGEDVKYWMLGNNEESLRIAERRMSEDSSSIYLRIVAALYSYMGQFEEAVPHWDRYLERLESSGRIVTNEMHRIGYAYWMNGDRKKGAYYLNMQMEYCENSIKLGRDEAKSLFTYYDLAGVYAFLGERDKAYENLRIFNQRDMMPLWIASLIKRDPLFNSIHDEPEFQQIVRDVEAKYQAEHERVREWLVKNATL